MFFGNPMHNQGQIQLCGVNIDIVNENTFLGVIIDNEICWTHHITHVKSKLTRSSSVLAKAKHVLDQKSLQILYNSLILPYLEYGIEVWGKTYKTTLQSLFILQKRAIRIVHNAHFKAHTNDLFFQI